MPPPSCCSHRARWVLEPGLGTCSARGTGQRLCCTTPNPAASHQHESSILSDGKASKEGVSARVEGALSAGGGFEARGRVGEDVMRRLQRCCLSLLISHTSQEHQGVPSSSRTTDPALAALYIQLLDNPWALSSPKAVLQRPGSPSPPPCTAQPQTTAQLPPGTTQTCLFQRGMLSFPFMRPPSDVPADHRKSTSQNTREMGTLGFAAHTGHRTLSRLWLHRFLVS